MTTPDPGAAKYGPCSGCGTSNADCAIPCCSACFATDGHTHPADEQPDYYERSDALTWVAITCAEREALVNERPGGRYDGMGVASSRTDDEVIYTEWYEKATETPLLRDWRFPGPAHQGPDRKPCEHRRPA